MRITKLTCINHLTQWAARLTLVVMIAWFVVPGSVSQAAIYACPDANGDTAFQDRPCAKINESKREDSKSTEEQSQYPLGLHPSWFIPPAYAPQPAYCDRLGCDCASQARNFRHGLTAAVADALFLEAAWHRYAEQVIEMETDPPSGLASLQLQISIEESACDIQMSQLTILNYVRDAVKSLKKRAELAEKRGNTDYAQCDGSNDKVCEDVDAYDLYQRVLMDLETLRSPRSFFVADAD